MGQLAARYGTSVRAIKSANGLSSTFLRAGRSYRIPVKTAAPPSLPVVVPFRLLPPTTPADLASASWPTTASLYGDSASLRFESPALLARAVLRALRRIRLTRPTRLPRTVESLCPAPVPRRHGGTR